MPTATHEALHRVFRESDDLFAEAVKRGLGVSVPVAVSAEPLDVNLTEIRPIERHSDTVLRVECESGATHEQFIVLIESQTEPDAERRMRWPYYVAYLHDKYECPVVLLVVCRKPATARWAEKAIEVGLPDLVSMVVTPTVLGPHNVAMITDQEEADHYLFLTMLSAFVHSSSERIGEILRVLAAALSTLEPQISHQLAEFVEGGLTGTPGLTLWKEIMATETYPYISELRRNGRLEGEARAVLKFLEARGIDVPAAPYERILDCKDSDTLDTWLIRATTITTIDELFV